MENFDQPGFPTPAGKYQPHTHTRMGSWSKKEDSVLRTSTKTWLSPPSAPLLMTLSPTPLPTPEELVVSIHLYAPSAAASSVIVTAWIMGLWAPWRQSGGAGSRNLVSGNEQREGLALPAGVRRRSSMWVLKAGSLPGRKGVLAGLRDEEGLEGAERGERYQNGKNLGCRENVAGNELKRQWHKIVGWGQGMGVSDTSTNVVFIL